MRTLLTMTPLAVVLISSHTLAEPASAVALPHATVAGHSLELQNDEGRCRIVQQPSGRAESLDLQWPCRFSLDKNQQVRVEPYEQSQVVMVEHTAREASQNQDCITYLRAVKVSGDGLEVARVGHRISSQCASQLWDQKLFVYGFQSKS